MNKDRKQSIIKREGLNHVEVNLDDADGDVVADAAVADDDDDVF